MVGHHIGPNRMHPNRSSCLSLTANGSTSWQIKHFLHSRSSCLACASEVCIPQYMALNLCHPVPSLGMVLAGRSSVASNASRKTKFFSQNILGKVRGTWTLKSCTSLLQNWIMFWPVLCCPVLFCLVMFRLILFCPVLFCSVQLCPARFCPVLIWLVMFYILPNSRFNQMNTIYWKIWMALYSGCCLSFVFYRLSRWRQLWC